MVETSVQIQLLSGFDDPGVTPDIWQHLLSSGDTDVVFLTQIWQRVWWEIYGRGRLLLMCAWRNDQPVALAPFFSDGGMIFFVGSGGSDYLDFLGDISDPEILDAILITARKELEDFVGFRFYLVPDQSRTGVLLQQAAHRLGLDIHDEGELAAPMLDLLQPGAAAGVMNKQSLRRHERWFERQGGFRVDEFEQGDEILPYLDEFFQQHVERWALTPYPSLFNEDRHRQFYRRLIRSAADAGWLRFTRIESQGRAVAFHFGFSYCRRYLYYKPTFALDVASQSPGQVLLLHLIGSAVREGACIFDFGIGDEPFKQRFATETRYVRTWGIYPKEG